LTALRGANDVLAFVLELAALAALIVWGFEVGPNLLRASSLALARRR